MPIFALPELAVMQTVADAVSVLSPAERRRVAAWLVEYAAQEDETPTVLVDEDVAVDSAPVMFDEDAADSFEEEAAYAEAAFDADADADDTPKIDHYETFEALLNDVAPKSGAQKATVAGYWLERKEGQDSWKASEVNKLLKSVGVKVSSISIVLSNAVRSKKTMVTELQRLGDKERSRKTFCLNDLGVAYVEERMV